MDDNVVDKLLGQVSTLNGELSGLNSKIDSMQHQISKITTALETLARVEERMSYQKEEQLKHERYINEIYEKISKQSERISNVEQKVGINTYVSRNVERIFWIVATAIVSIITLKFKQ